MLFFEFPALHLCCRIQHFPRNRVVGGFTNDSVQPFPDAHPTCGERSQQLTRGQWLTVMLASTKVTWLSALQD